jgi:hypothetical protein
MFVLQFFFFSEWMWMLVKSHRFWMTPMTPDRCQPGTFFSMLFPSAIFWRMDFPVIKIYRSWGQDVDENDENANPLLPLADLPEDHRHPSTMEWENFLGFSIGFSF